MSKAKLCSKCGASVNHEVAGGFCSACLLEEGLRPRDRDETSTLSKIFGDYELVEEIARGGMGVVFKARQRSLNRTVAVKMILSGHLASEAESQRFRTEAETAAQLQHSNIVAIHEIGEQEGQPFFCMDFVKGQNLAQLVREVPLPSRKAASYLKTIAETVQYAHSRGVLHRDLKPSNILIDEHDQPRVTDFGLAKRLTDPQLSTNDPQLTQTGQVLGSPSFIPPEQAAGQKDKFGPASDVYSLGAILYHCLTGRPPFMAETLTQTLRMVAEQEPVSPRLLNASVPRDLETICLKCLAKEPRRRYETAQALAEDLDRHLHDEPILARPASSGEKAWSWCRRKPALATACVLVLFVAVGAPIAAFKINRERQQAEANERRAEKEVARSSAAFRFMVSMLEGVRPSVARGRDRMMLREILDDTAMRVGTDLKGQPEAEADLRVILGKTYSDLGLITNALEMTQEALRLRRLHLAPTNTAIADALNNLGAMLYAASDYAGAANSAREAFAIRTNALGLWNTNVATSLNNLGLALLNQGKIAESAQAQNLALQIRKKLLPVGHPHIGMSLANLAMLQWAQGNFTSAETNFVEALELYQQVGNGSAVALVEANLATVFARRGNLAGARALHERTLERRQKLYQADHPDLEISLTQLGLVLANQGDLAAAEARFKEALAMQQRLKLGQHVDVADAIAGLGTVAMKRGEWAAATEKYDQALAIRLERLADEGNPDIVDSLDTLGVLAIARSDWEAAERALVRAVEATRKSEGNNYPAVIPALWHLAWVQERRGATNEARMSRDEALMTGQRHGDYGAWPLLKGIFELAEVLKLQHKFPEAEAALKQAADYLQKNVAGNPVLSRATFEQFARFYEAWDRAAPNTGKSEQAAEWRNLL